jgi:hypothetical protein
VEKRMGVSGELRLRLRERELGRKEEGAGKYELKWKRGRIEMRKIRGGCAGE